MDTPELKEEPRFSKVAILGVGLMGGSIGKALLRKGLAGTVAGLFRRKSTLEEAVSVGVVTEAYLDAAPVVENAGAVIYAAGVGTVVDHLEQTHVMVPDGALVTDVGSTKKVVVEKMAEVFAGREVFPAGSHPLYGSHMKGPAAGAKLSPEGHRAAVVPIEGHPNSLDAASRAERFWQSLGMKTIRLDAMTHDRMLAYSSHLPHLIAMALVKALPEAAEEFVSSGFLDTTRVAASPPAVWRDIFATNIRGLREALEGFKASADEIAGLLEKGGGEKLLAFLSSVKDRRDRMNRE